MSGLLPDPTSNFCPFPLNTEMTIATVSNSNVISINSDSRTVTAKNDGNGATRWVIEQSPSGLGYRLKHVQSGRYLALGQNIPSGDQAWPAGVSQSGIVDLRFERQNQGVLFRSSWNPGYQWTLNVHYNSNNTGAEIVFWPGGPKGNSYDTWIFQTA